nr:unnamed protein product [Digitaria exilis]
MYHEFLLFN